MPGAQEWGERKAVMQKRCINGGGEGESGVEVWPGWL